MNNAFYQTSSSPTPHVGDIIGDILIDEESRDGQDSFDLYNEDTFGSGAVEEDWELEHNQLVDLDDPAIKSESFGLAKLGINIPKENFLKLTSSQQNPVLSPSQLNEEELEKSNQELAAAVEGLVLESDLDQDAIDPAIVSLRKQAPKTYGNVPVSPKLLPYYDSSGAKQFDGGDLSAIFGKKLQNPFTGKNLESIWKDSQKGDFKHVESENQPMNERHDSAVFSRATSLEDTAILSAVKNSTSTVGRSTPLIVKAEDLEREMQSASSTRVSSPPYGISIPRQSDQDTPSDRSLPARSVSPVFGSPSPNTMPIGTPPKHIIMNIMHQLEQQQREQNQNPPHVTGASGVISHPPLQPPVGINSSIPPPRLSLFLNRPPPPFNGQRVTMSPNGQKLIWPATGPPVPVNALVTQDVIARLGLRMPGSPLHGSPMGSPRAIPTMAPTHVINSQNVRRPLNLPQPGLIRPMMPPQHHQRMDHRQQRSSRNQRFGPGHLHPEHSQFVRLRQERRNNHHDRRAYQRNPSRDDVIVGVPGDPHANIMTQKEKDWVINIQMMALQSDRPEIDDYYYQNYMERRLRDGKLHASDSSKTPQRLITPSKPNVENRKYVPVQFNNSLGKLTTSSVYNPRQIIDVVQSSNQDEEASESSDENRQSLSKRLVVYKKIEKGYDLIVMIEELDVAKDSYHDPTERELADDDLKNKIKLMVEALGFHDNIKDSVFPIMKIRKGKKLLARAMPYLLQSDRFLVVHSILSHLPILIKRDHKDGVLQELYAAISHTLSLLNVEQFLEILTKMNSFNLTAAVRDQVGVSITCKLLDRGRELYAGDSAIGKERWNKFVSDVSVVIVAVANPKEGSRHPRPSTPSPLLEEFPYDVFEILAPSQNSGEELETLRSSFQRLIVNSPSNEELGVEVL